MCSTGASCTAQIVHVFTIYLLVLPLCSLYIPLPSWKSCNCRSGLLGNGLPVMKVFPPRLQSLAPPPCPTSGFICYQMRQQLHGGCFFLSIDCKLKECSVRGWGPPSASWEGGERGGGRFTDAMRRQPADCPECRASKVGAWRCNLDATPKSIPVMVC